MSAQIDNENNVNASESVLSENGSGRRFAKPAYVPLLLAAIFMIAGTVFLVYLGREEARLRGVPLGEMDLKPLLYTEKEIGENDFKGKVVVLHFWGYWLKDYTDLYSEFAEIQKEYADSEEVLVLSVSCDQRVPEKKDDLIFYTKKFFSIGKIDDLPVYWDPAIYSRKRLDELFAPDGFNYPTTVILDEKSNISYVWKSAVRADKLRNSIEETRKRK